MPLQTPSQFLVDDPAGPRRPTGWRQGLLTLGYWRALVLCTGVSIVASLLVTAVLAWLKIGQALTPQTLFAAVLVPLLVSPVIGHYGFSLLYELAQSRALLHQAAIRDGLTGAYNRRFFMSRLDIEVARAHRDGQPLAVLMIDVDHFKAINDSHGHAAGDQVLEQLARVLATTLRPYDLVARYGGEEFVALMPGSSLQQAAATAERVRSAVAGLSVTPTTASSSASSADSSPPASLTASARAPAADQPVTVTASVGASSLGPAEGNGAALLERADRAMYAAKRSGRNRCVVLGPDNPG